ncbi:MAG: hypothetical protein WAV55_00565 [Clostridiaceae bacterium]
MKKLMFNLLLSVSLFVVVSILMPVANTGLSIIELFLNLRVQGPTEITRTLELVSYLIFLPVLAYMLSRLIYKIIFKKTDVSFNGIYFGLGFLIIILGTILLITYSTRSIFSIPLYDNKVSKLLLNYQNIFKKSFDFRTSIIIETTFHNLLIVLFGTAGINRYLKNKKSIN